MAGRTEKKLKCHKNRRFTCQSCRGGEGSALADQVQTSLQLWPVSAQRADKVDPLNVREGGATSAPRPFISFGESDWLSKINIG